METALVRAGLSRLGSPYTALEDSQWLPLLDWLAQCCHTGRRPSSPPAPSAAALAPALAACGVADPAALISRRLDPAREARALLLLVHTAESATSPRESARFSSALARAAALAGASGAFGAPAALLAPGDWPADAAPVTAEGCDAALCDVEARLSASTAGAAAASVLLATSPSKRPRSPDPGAADAPSAAPSSIQGALVAAVEFARGWPEEARAYAVGARGAEDPARLGAGAAEAARGQEAACWALAEARAQHQRVARAQARLEEALAELAAARELPTYEDELAQLRCVR
eukprot:m51a1_g2970 hypothetical protein (290) ;mRNA; f:700616-701485